MRYYIDGYNVTRRDPATRGLSLEDQRAALEERLRMRGRTLLGTASYLIVWDGAGGEGCAGPLRSEVRFTRKPTADDAIVDGVRAASSRVGVITSDHGLASRCREAASHGVEILPAERLFASAAKAGKGARRTRSSGEPGIPPNANRINEELKKIWGIED